MIPLCKTLIHEDAITNATRVLRSGWPGMGSETEAFEKEFASYIGAKYAIATNSGTEALRIATHIASRNTKYGYAITTPNTFVSTNAVLVQNEMHLIFTDIEYKTGNMFIGDAEMALRLYNCGLIMLVHYGGYPPDMAAFEDLAYTYKVEIIHDCAHATGTIYNDKHVGAGVKYACYSFHAVKNLPIGDGGMLVTNSEEVDTKARQLRWLGIDKSTFKRVEGSYTWEYDCADVGYKAHMWDVQAAIGRGQLPHLDEWNAKRQELADRYRKNLFSCSFPQPLNTPAFGNQTSNYLFVVQFKDKEMRKKATDLLAQNDVQFGYHYKPTYLYEPYKCYSTMGTMNMDRFYETSLSIPLHLFMTADDVDLISELVIEASIK